MPRRDLQVSEHDVVVGSSPDADHRLIEFDALASATTLHQPP
jgi:hypothetical protein